MKYIVIHGAEIKECKTDAEVSDCIGSRNPDEFAVYHTVKKADPAKFVVPQEPQPPKPGARPFRSVMDLLPSTTLAPAALAGTLVNLLLVGDVTPENGKTVMETIADLRHQMATGNYR